MKTNLIILLVSLGLFGCAQQNQKASEVNVSGYLYQVKVHEVKNGMSEAQVVSIMGDSPSSRSETAMAQGKVKALGWTHYNTATRKAYAVYFQFLDDKVIGRTESGI